MLRLHKIIHYFVKSISILHTTKNVLYLDVIKSYFYKKNQKQLFLIIMNPIFDSNFRMWDTIYCILHPKTLNLVLFVKQLFITSKYKKFLVVCEINIVYNFINIYLFRSQCVFLYSSITRELLKRFQTNSVFILLTPYKQT